jgi:aspartyl-tRNA(Asn)/glutamyl-tRNA(Gln) amidotransferase subunit A
MSDLFELSGLDAAAKFRDGSLSPVEFVDALLTRLGEVEPDLRAWVAVDGGQAREQARRAAEELQAGTDRGPLHGIPLGVKDLIETRDLPTRAGSRHLDDVAPARDAAVVDRLRAAGTVVVGKTNTHEFGYGGVVPPTRNPWAPERIPGGSSGGSAVALAAGTVPLALGTDAAGSVRIPAALCGVTGVKPTYGTVPTEGTYPCCWTLDHVGAMARTAADAAVLLRVMAGDDPSQPPRPRSLSGLRIGVPRVPFFEPAQPGVVARVDEAIAVLADAGAQITEVALPTAALAPLAGLVIILSEGSELHRHRLQRAPERFQPDVRAFLELGTLLPANLYVRATRFQRLFRDQLRDVFDEVDLLATPTLACTAPGQGEPVVDLGGTTVDLVVAQVGNTLPFNLAGTPAGTVPCGFDADGLPVGLQLIGRPFEDDLVLATMQAFQEATDWHTRLPPVGEVPVLDPGARPATT